MSHNYEEIRKAAVEILSGQETSSYEPNQYAHLKIGIAEVFRRREKFQDDSSQFGRDAQLSQEDADLFLEVFWDLFRQGIITLGLNDSNQEFPFFRVTGFGKRVLEKSEPYFFHDVSGYEKIIKGAIPKIDNVTLIYLKEAMQAFQSGCVLSASVMVGVAAEHSFLKLLEVVVVSKKHGLPFKSVVDERTILQKITKFKNILDQQKAVLTPELKEDFETNFLGLLSMIRNFRNESGHPSGKIISREQCFVLLQVFIPCCKKIYQLLDFFKKS